MNNSLRVIAFFNWKILNMKRILVVGAGFAGAVYARVCAEAGFRVDIIDKRSHIAGNCFDYLHDSGVRVHKYGPHLFHTSNMRVVEWLSRFTQWNDYQHKVVARLPSGKLTPMPVNLDTINDVFGQQLETPEQVAALLQDHVTPCEQPAHAEDYLYSKIGAQLTNLFYRPYTLKMWNMDLTETAAEIVKRLQIRMDREDRYFPSDSFQALPKDGYTALFEKILSHDNISIQLDTEFSDILAAPYDTCFNSMPIDEYFDCDLGELPYRSIKFHIEEIPVEQASKNAVINYTDDGPYTRETWWHCLAGHHEKQGAAVIKTVEEPCGYKDNNMERFYPVKTSDGRYDTLYRQYAERGPDHAEMYFIGRCGTYQYLDMHQVINQSLMGAEKWLEKQAL
jgi:UDP-galactopyranose mutase